MENNNQHHHHHNSTHQHSHKKHNNKKMYVLSFFLFLSFLVLSLSICSKVMFVNPQKIASVFTSPTYCQGLQNDVLTYAHDMCDKHGINYDSVDANITYEQIYDVENSYISNKLNTSQQFNNDAFEVNVDKLNTKIYKSTKSMIKNNGYKVDKQMENNIKEFSTDISNYLYQQVDFEYMAKLQTVTNIGKVLSVVIMIISVIISMLIISAIMLNKSNKKYRNLRFVAFSTIAVTMFDVLLLLSMAIVRMTKDLVIYPTYLCQSAMKFVNYSMATIGYSGLFSLCVSVVILTVLWKLKRDEK